MKSIRVIARRILRDEIEDLRLMAKIQGALAREREILEERRLAGAAAVAAWEAAVEAGSQARSLARRRSSRRRLRATA